MDDKRLLQRSSKQDPNSPPVTDLQLAKANWELEEAILSDDTITLVKIPKGMEPNFKNIEKFISDKGGSGE